MANTDTPLQRYLAFVNGNAPAPPVPPQDMGADIESVVARLDALLERVTVMSRAPHHIGG